MNPVAKDLPTMGGEVAAQRDAVPLQLAAGERQHVSDDVVDMSSVTCGPDFVASARSPRITSTARPAARTMREVAARASSRSGSSRLSQRRHALPLVAMAASGWLISCAMDAASSPSSSVARCGRVPFAPL